jgi:CheY-like chemotaxis protein
VLVVDDDVRNAFSLTALLERDRATVVIAESGPAAIAMLAQTPDIDIVLMDIMMPIMDGYETIRAIRAFDDFKRLPIIAVTAKVVTGERQRCIDAGANDFVPKPINSTELLAALGPWLNPSCGRHPVTTVPGGMGSASSSVPILLVDDNAGKRLALKAVLAPLGFRVVEADSGFAALRHILHEDFAMILLDVCMPVMDGFATAALIRERKRNEMTPIIFITAYTEDEIPATDRYTGGAVDFIFAPRASRRAALQGLRLRPPLRARPGARTCGTRGPDHRRPAAAAHRCRAHRHLPHRQPRDATSTRTPAGRRSPG